MLGVKVPNADGAPPFGWEDVPVIQSKLSERA